MTADTTCAEPHPAKITDLVGGQYRVERLEAVGSTGIVPARDARLGERALP